MEVRFEPVVQSHALTCPTCREGVFRAHAGRCEPPTGGPWLKDGGIAAGLHLALDEEQRAGGGAFYELLLGDCPFCRGSFYVVEATLGGLIDAEALVGATPTKERNYLCTIDQGEPNVPPLWLVREDDTPVGRRHTHLFGPFEIGNISGQDRVSACGATSEAWIRARVMLLTLWDSLRAAYEQRIVMEI